jgi:glucosamine-phosphate N-acetyltransferase
MIRPLCQNDFDNGFYSTLKYLTVVGEIEFDKDRSKDILNHLPPNIQIFVYIDNQQVIGTITLLIESKFIRNGGKVGHIEDLSVHGDHQGLGIGRQLVNHCLQICQDQKCYKVILDCSDSNVGFYNKLGFISSGNCMRYNLK